MGSCGSLLRRYAAKEYKVPAGQSNTVNSTATSTTTHRALLIAVGLGLCCGALIAGAQTRIPAHLPGQANHLAGSVANLPDKDPAGEPKPAVIPDSGTITGCISDASGALIPGALISLYAPNGAVARRVSSDAEGRFRFSGLLAGSYGLSVSAPGFESPADSHILLHAGEDRDLPELRLAIPADHADIVVTVTRRELATEEMHAEEQQRIVGFPDFYTSYVPNPAPLDSEQKFSLALRATTDRMSFAGAALIAGAEQVQNTFPAYGRGFQGYAKRYGAAYTDAFTGKLIGYALLPSVFRQDPRYFYMGTGSYKHRALHAILSAVIARGDNGHIEPNYSHILGNAAAGAISTLYHPATDSAGKLALDNALLGTLGEAGVNLTREFILKHFTRGLASPVPTHP